VIYGMQHVDLLRRGSPPGEPDRIVRLSVLSDLIE